MRVLLIDDDEDLRNLLSRYIRAQWADAQIEAYDPRTDTWQNLGQMPLPTHGLTRAAVLDGRIHIPGGSVTVGGNNGTTLHQAYRPERRCDQ